MESDTIEVGNEQHHLSSLHSSTQDGISSGDLSGMMMQVTQSSGDMGHSSAPFYQSRLNVSSFDKHVCQRCQKSFAARSSLLRHARKCPMLHFHPYAAPAPSSSSSPQPQQQLFSVFHSSVGTPSQPPSRVETMASSSGGGVVVGGGVSMTSYPPPVPAFTVPPISRDTLDEDERIISVPTSEAESLEVVFGEVDGYCIGRKKIPPPNTPLPIIITDMVCFLLRTRNRGGFMPTNSTWRHPIAALLLTLGLSREDLDNTLGLNYKNRKTPSLEHSVLQVQQKTTSSPGSPPPSRSTPSRSNSNPNVESS